MTNKVHIPQLHSSLNDYRALKRDLNKMRRRIAKLDQYYSFVDEIFSANVDDNALEDHVYSLFKDLGFFVIKPTKNDDFDVIAKCDLGVLGIEVKNSKLVPENDMFQGRKYASRHKEKTGNSVSVLVVWNNGKTRQQFDENRIGDARRHDFGIITTQELLKGYLKVKQQKIDLALFKRLIFQTGLIRYTRKAT